MYSSKFLILENFVKISLVIGLLYLQEKSKLETDTYPSLNRDGLHIN